MNGKERQRVASGRRSDIDDPVGALLRLASRREDPPAARAARIETAVLREWSAGVAAGARRRKVVYAVAAALALAVLAPLALRTWRSAPGTATGTLTARVERVTGEAWVEDATSGEPAGPLVRGQELPAGVMLVTGPAARAAVELDTGHVVRLDVGTRVRVEGARLELRQGAVYADSNHAPNEAGLSIATGFGEVRDIGTRFEVRLPGDRLLVRVRDGRVRVDRGDGTTRIEAGEEWSVDSHGTSARRTVSPFDADWSWVESVVPMMVIEGRRLDEFLDWVARERGLQVRFQPEELRRSHAAIELSGSVERMSLDEALESVLATCGLSQRIESGVLWIGEAVY